MALEVAHAHQKNYCDHHQGLKFLLAIEIIGLLTHTSQWCLHESVLSFWQQVSKLHFKNYNYPPSSHFAYLSPLYSPHLYFLVKSLFGPSVLIVILEFGVRQVVVKIEVLLGNSSTNLGQSLIVAGCKELVHQFYTLQKAVGLNFEGANLDDVWK